MWRDGERVRIRGCRREAFCQARAVDDPLPRLMRGWTCSPCGFGDVAEFAGWKDDPPWPAEMIFEEGKTT